MGHISDTYNNNNNNNTSHHPQGEASTYAPPSSEPPPPSYQPPDHNYPPPPLPDQQQYYQQPGPTYYAPPPAPSGAPQTTPHIPSNQPPRNAFATFYAPPNNRSLALKRRLLSFAICFVIGAVIIGLAAGLTRRRYGSCDW